MYRRTLSVLLAFTALAFLTVPRSPAQQKLPSVDRPPTPLVTDQPSKPSADDSLQRQRQAPVTEYDTFRRPTEFLKPLRLLPEWETARYLVLGMPQNLFIQKEIADTFLQTIKHALEVTDVLLLINAEDSIVLRYLFELLEKSGLEERVLPTFNRKGELPRATVIDQRKPNQPGMIHIVPIAVDSYWIRDYGPVFGVHKNQLCLLDSIYRDVRKERMPLLFSTGEGDRPDDDRVPTMLGPLLAARHLSAPVKVVRPPVQLSGGDFFTDGAGVGFTSTTTLAENGGVEEAVTLRLCNYYGLDRVVYLEPLPGHTIKHLDMFFRPVGNSKSGKATFLLAEYPEDVPAASTAIAFLHKEAHATLERNAGILRDKFPEAVIIRVKLPPLTFREDQASMVRSSVYSLGSVALEPKDWLLQGDWSATKVPEHFGELAVDFGLRNADKGGLRPGSRSATMRRLVSAWKRVEDPIPESVEDSERNLLAQQIALIKKKDTLLKKNASELEWEAYRQEFKDLRDRTDELQLVCKYKTYLNAVHLKGRLKEKVLVPSYQRYQSLEAEARRQFQLAYPDAEIVFIPADKITEQFGALHCITCVLPELPPSADK